MLRFARFWVAVFEEKIGDVVAHGQAAYAVIVIPGKVNAG